MKADQMIRLLAEFGRIPEHQVRFIWNLAYDHGREEAGAKVARKTIVSAEEPVRMSHTGECMPGCYCDIALAAKEPQRPAPAKGGNGDG